MLDSARLLQGYTLDSLDGDIGSVKDFYFDDQYWAIRYLVADTGGWLAGRKVLLSPHALREVNREKRYIGIQLTRKQIEDSPSLDSDRPVSRQFEEAYYGYFGWPLYWSGSFMWGAYPYLEQDREHWQQVAPGEKPWDAHMRSTGDVTGHHIQASDGGIGHVEDFIIDDMTWAIRYLVVDTRNFWSGKKVLVSPQWIERVSWHESKVIVNLTRDAIKESPEYTEASLPSRDYEASLYGHYNRPGYWVAEPAALKVPSSE